MFGEQKEETEEAGCFPVSRGVNKQLSEVGSFLPGAAFSEGCLIKLASQDPWTRVLKAMSDLGSEVCQVLIWKLDLQ